MAEIWDMGQLKKADLEFERKNPIYKIQFERNPENFSQAVLDKRVAMATPWVLSTEISFTGCPIRYLY